jgi:hypothetical protein
MGIQVQMLVGERKQGRAGLVNRTSRRSLLRPTRSS